ncbi:thiopeptide-type bacteriocin biosynthesis protein [Flavobacterium psychrophilum]
MISESSVIEKNSSNKLTPTLNVVFEVLVCKKTKKETIYCKSLLNGGSAIRVLSRFSHVTKNTCIDISEYEKTIYHDKLIAEINMVDISRTINIFSPEQYFDYNIPVNCSYTEDSSPILLSDIYLRFDGSDFVLVSKYHKKEIIPRTISAINHQIYKSDIYRFLTEMQLQKNEIKTIDLDLNHYKYNAIQFVPRIYLENDILLYPAQVLLVSNNLKLQDFKQYVYNTIKENLFSLRVCIAEEKGNIVIDLENDEHIEKLYDKIKEKKYLYVTENLYDSFLPVVENDHGNYSHEFLASIKNTEFINKNLILKTLKDEDFCEQGQVAENWFYFELYCNSYAESEVLNYINDSIISEIEYGKFFFVRYGSPESHIRVRFSNVSNENKDRIVKLINELKFKNIIGNYMILPYNQELYRYGGSEMMKLTESVFYQDSLDTLKIIKEDLKDGDLYIYSILKICFYLNFFDVTTDKMIEFCENSVTNFAKEFELKSDLRKSFNADFAKIKNKIQEFEYENFLFNLDFKTELMNELKISTLTKENYLSSIIHMSMNRLFNENQRYNEFKTYYLTKCYLNQLKFTQKNNN